MRIPILMYHAVDDIHSVISIPTNEFEWQMRFLIENDYRILPLIDIVRFLKKGKTLPARSIAITFDDGFESVYRNAYPILSNHKIPATTFLVTGFCGRSNDWPGQPSVISTANLASWSQIREMDKNGIQFGSHTINHPRLDNLPKTQLLDEMSKSKLMIETKLDHPIDFFSYPYGRYNDEVLYHAKKIYQGACTAKLGFADNNSDPYTLERIDVYYIKNRVVFRKLCNPLVNNYLNLRRILHSMNSKIFRRVWD